MSGKGEGKEILRENRPFNEGGEETDGGNQLIVRENVECIAFHVPYQIAISGHPLGGSR